ncbi:MAG: hypothetical protein J7K30_14690 [Deltaproteobacteria bacterium]|nr:hypothetical protein [Deltaproteobacteria bacterium]
MNCISKNYLQQITLAMMAGLVGATLIGCAVTPTIPALSREQVPQGGRFTVVIRETGKLTMMNVGTTIFSNATQRVKTPNQVLERMRTAVIDALGNRRAFEYVPNNLKLEFVPPPYYINSYDKSFSYGSNVATKAQEAMLTVDMKKLADELNVDLIVVINEWGSSDYILHTNQPLDGFGVYFRSILGLRKIYAYIAYQLRVFEPKSGHYRELESWAAKQLDNSRWVDVNDDSPLSVESIKPFVVDIESISPPEDLSASLCILGLLPIQQGSSGFFDSGKCKDSYRPK